MVDASAAEFMSVPQPQETASQPRPSLQRELLLCGVHAVNSVLEVLGRPKLSKEQVDNINENLAYEERQVLDEGVAPDNAVQPAGNYPIEVLTLALRVYGDCETERIRQPPIPSGLYLVGNGYHWAMAASGPNGRWAVYDEGGIFPVADEHSFFRNRLQRGAVLRIVPASQWTTESPFMQAFAALTDAMDTDDSSSKRKAEQEHEDAPDEQAVRTPASTEVAPLTSEPAVPVNEYQGDGASVTSSQRQRRGRSAHRLDRTPKRNGSAERARTAQRKVERERQMPPPAPMAARDEPVPAVEQPRQSPPTPPPTLGKCSAAQPLSSTLSLPTVSCTNCPTIPTSERRPEYPVVSGRCTSCMMAAIGPAHKPVGTLQFPEAEQFAMFVHAYHVEDEEGSVL